MLESLELASRSSPSASPNRRIVAVVGVGHMDGIENRYSVIPGNLFVCHDLIVFSVVDG